MQIECSNCGARQRFKYTTANVNCLLAFGWFNYGDKLYCPKCMANPEKHFKAHFEHLNTLGEAIRFKDVIKKIAERHGV